VEPGSGLSFAKSIAPKDRIIVALDVDNAFRALQLVNLLKGHVGVFKVGLELSSAVGTGILEKLREAGASRIFYDAKLHDIPNTVTGAMHGVVRLGAWCVTVHATGGATMMRSAVAAAKERAVESNAPRPKVLAVTALTSISETILRDELRISVSMKDYVQGLAALARDAGCDGVIASPHEIATIRDVIPDPEFLVITPGVRPKGSDRGDQERIMTPGEAIALGASYLVVGRPIVSDPNPTEAAVRIAAEIAAQY
jgi:orotidine-5'-phosphate decarboxylase